MVCPRFLQQEPEPLLLPSPMEVQLQEQRTMNFAAAKLQTFYRGHRIRRKIADSAVIKERWGQLSEYARLTHSTVSFFDLWKPRKAESAKSRWSRMTLNASKVGNGSSKDEKARQLDIKHWIEAIDPQHRYGHNLQMYYSKWNLTHTTQPFFYWLDIGDGRDIEVKECPRSLLKHQRIKYLGPLEREHYEYELMDGKIVHKQTGDPLDTSKGHQYDKCIFVMSPSKKLYAGQKQKGIFQHSSFLAGGTTLAAGRLIAKNGVLKDVWAYSGHYKPTDKELDIFLTFLREKGIDLEEDQIHALNDDFNEDLKADQEQASRSFNSPNTA